MERPSTASWSYVTPADMCTDCRGKEITDEFGQVQFQSCVAFLMNLSAKEREQYLIGEQGWEELAADQDSFTPVEDAERAINCFENEGCRVYHEQF